MQRLKNMLYLCRVGDRVNKKGQALVEFVIILPILILLIFAFFFFGRIILCQSKLENIMNTVVLLEDNQIDDYLKKIDEYKIDYQLEINEYKKYTLHTKLELVTPGLKKILHNPYDVKVERRVINE